MRTTEQVTLDGYTYRITQLGSKLGRNVLARLVKTVGAAVEEGSFAALCKGLSDEDLDYFCDAFAKSTQLQATNTYVGLDTTFDEHFAGKYGAMFRWLWACLKLNYNGFLAEFGISAEALESLLESIKGTASKAAKAAAEAVQTPAPEGSTPQNQAS